MITLTYLKFDIPSYIEGHWHKRYSASSIFFKALILISDKWSEFAMDSYKWSPSGGAILLHHPSQHNLTSSALFLILDPNSYLWSYPLETVCTDYTRSLSRLSAAYCVADKETLLTSYTAIGQSMAKHVPPVWSQHVSERQWKYLQTCQNTALRRALGFLCMNSLDHRHEETKIIPVEILNTCRSIQVVDKALSM